MNPVMHVTRDLPLKTCGTGELFDAFRENHKRFFLILTKETIGSERHGQTEERRRRWWHFFALFKFALLIRL